MTAAVTTPDVASLPEAELAAMDAPPVTGEVSMEEAAKIVFGEDPAPEKPADAPVPATAPEKPVEEPAPDPKAERVAARIAVAKRAELRAAQEREQIRRDREEVDRKAAELAAKEARFKLLEEDPVKAFEELKLDPKTFLERLAGEQDPTNVVAKEVAKLRADLKAEQEARLKAEQDATRRQASEQTEAAFREASAVFVQHVEAHADKYPHLVSEFTEAEAIEAAFRAVNEVVGYDSQNQPVTRGEAYRQEFGAYPDDDVIAEHLDAQAKARAEARQKSAWRKRGDSAATPSQGTPNGDPQAAQPVKGSSPRTLTSRAASEKATAPKQWTQEQADEESLRILSGAFRP